MAEFQGYPIVDDSFRSDNPNHGRGYTGRDLDQFPRGGLKCARMVTRPKIDPKNFKDIIKDKDAHNKWITVESDRRGRKRKNQKNTNYCWNAAGTGGMEYCILKQGGPLLNLSNAYAGSMITGGSNVGGSGVVFVNWAHEHGVPTTEFWQENHISGRDDAAANANAKKHTIELYDEFDPSDYDTIASYILNDDPVTVGDPSWGHEYILTRLGWNDQTGRLIWIFDNTWGDEWGNKGRGICEGRHLIWDEAAAIVNVRLSLT